MASGSLICHVAGGKDRMPEQDQLLDVADVARWLKLYKRDGVTLNTKRVYELPIRKTKVGARVRYVAGDVRLYLNLHAGRAA